MFLKTLLRQFIFSSDPKPDHLLNLQKIAIKAKLAVIRLIEAIKCNKKGTILSVGNRE